MTNFSYPLRPLGKLYPYKNRDKQLTKAQWLWRSLWRSWRRNNAWRPRVLLFTAVFAQCQGEMLGYAHDRICCSGVFFCVVINKKSFDCVQKVSFIVYAQDSHIFNLPRPWPIWNICQECPYLTLFLPVPSMYSLYPVLAFLPPSKW